MAVVFISNDPSVRSTKFKANGQALAFVRGVLEVEPRLVEAVKARNVWPIYGVHFHLRDAEEPLPADEAPVAVRQGARGTVSFKGVRDGK